ncbi:MAG: helix-turn-helix domain-containing protein [Candidatus Limnocylindrales bacterium]
MSTADTAVANDWLTIREASALVGVSVATLRRWCDAGLVRVFTTPGGHRRFARSAVLDLVPAREPETPIAHGGETAIRIVRAYRRIHRDVDALPAAIAQMEPRDRNELRDHGRHIVGALVDALDASEQDRATHHARARASAAACGSMAGAAGMPLQETLALFVRFRGPFLHELGAVCRRRGCDARATAHVLEQASDALDRLLPAVISGYEGAGG